MIVIIGGKTIKGNVKVTVAPSLGSDAVGEDPSEGE